MQVSIGRLEDGSRDRLSDVSSWSVEIPVLLQRLHEELCMADAIVAGDLAFVLEVRRADRCCVLSAAIFLAAVVLLRATAPWAPLDNGRRPIRRHCPWKGSDRLFFVAREPTPAAELHGVRAGAEGIRYRDGMEQGRGQRPPYLA